jgi:hypothetical protein
MSGVRNGRRGDPPGDVEGFLLVDNRDGRVLEQIIDPVEALRLLDELQLDYPELAAALCLIRFDERQGSVIATKTTTRVRSLT